MDDVETLMTVRITPNIRNTMAVVAKLFLLELFIGIIFLSFNIFLSLLKLKCIIVNKKTLEFSFNI
jgi:hypothetical protein